MRAEHFSAGSEDDVSSSVMGLELLSSIGIDFEMDLLAFVKLDVALKWSIKGVQDNLTYFDSIDDFVFSCTALYLDDSSIMLLSSRCWVDSRPIEDQKIWNVLLSDVFEHIKDSGIMLNQTVIIVEDSISLWEMSGLIKDLLLLLGCPLLPHGDLIVKVLRNWSFHDL